MKKVVYGSLILLWLAQVSTAEPTLSPAYPGRSPGLAQASLQDQTMTLANRAIKAQWQGRHGTLEFESVTDGLRRNVVTGSKDLFKIVLHDGRVITPSVMTMTAAPSLHPLVPRPIC